MLRKRFSPSISDQVVRNKHYNFYDDTVKATAVALTETPDVPAKHVSRIIRDKRLVAKKASLYLGNLH